MAWTVAGGFDVLHRSLLPTDAQVRSLQPKANTAHAYLSDRFTTSTNMPLLRTKLIGSAAHDTLVRPVDDIDLMAVFNISQPDFDATYSKNSQAFIQRVKGAFDGSRVETIGVRGQAVRLFYKDNIHVDIAPVFEWNTGGYILPAGDGTWLRTNPDIQEAWFNQEDRRLRGQLRPLVRVIKKWNATHGKQLKSFHLAVLVANTFHSLGANRAEAVAMFFRQAANNLSAQDPAGHSGNLSSYLTLLAALNIKTRLSSAADRAQKAIAAERLGNHNEATRLWRIEFGTDFPIFG